MAISKYACYIYDSGKHLLKQGSLSYNSSNGKYTFSNTLANINQGEINETRIVIAVPDDSYNAHYPFITVRTPQGWNSQPLAMTKADILIYEESVGTTYQVAYIDLALVGLTRYAGVHVFAVGWLSNGSYITLDPSKYTVDDGVNDYEDIEADYYDEISTSLEATFVAYAARLVEIENYLAGAFDYVGGQTDGVRELVLYNLTQNATLTFDGAKLVITIDGVDYTYAVKETTNTFDEINTFLKGINVNSTKVTMLANGTVSTDAVNKGQLDLKIDTTKIISTIEDGTTGKIVDAQTIYEKFLNKVETSFTIAGLSLEGASITLAALKTAIGEATTEANGLLSASDKTLIDVLRASYSDDDGNSLVDTIKEVLTAFDGYPETTDLMAYFATKVDKVTGKELSENDLTDALKADYDASVVHANKTNGTNPHLTTYDNLVSKPTTFADFGLSNGTVETIEATTSVTTPKLILANGVYMQYNSTLDAIEIVFPE
jgi:hypothetical protein